MAPGARSAGQRLSADRGPKPDADKAQQRSSAAPAPLRSSGEARRRSPSDEHRGRRLSGSCCLSFSGVIGDVTPRAPSSLALSGRGSDVFHAPEHLESYAKLETNAPALCPAGARWPPVRGSFGDHPTGLQPLRGGMTGNRCSATSTRRASLQADGWRMRSKPVARCLPIGITKTHSRPRVSRSCAVRRRNSMTRFCHEFFPWYNR